MKSKFNAAKSITATPSKRLNAQYGLTEVYQHDLDDKSQTCEKCHRNVEELIGGLNICSVIGKQEVEKFRHYE